MTRRVAKWLTPESLTLIRGMACMGKSQEQIAACMGISPSTLRNWQKQYPEIASALAFGKENADYAVMEALHRKAVGYTTPLKKTYKLKHTEFDPESGKKVLEYEELQTGIDETHVPADTRAEIFWLQNRCPEDWVEDKTEALQEGGGVIELPPVMQADRPPERDE